MPTTFTRAPAVTPGAALTSQQYRGLARAINDRARVVGDLAWRVSWYWYTLWRQVRNSDDSGSVFPPQGEWYDIFAHIDPDYVSVEWPANPPGTPEGANLGNPAMAYVYGVENGPESEPDRIQIPLAKPNTLLGHWQLGKDQRGAYDPATTAQNAPAFDAGVSVFSIAFNSLVPLIKAYGGWKPQPERLLENCGDTEATGLNIPSYRIQFTALRPDAPTSGLHGSVEANDDGNPVVAYAGTCPCGSDYHSAGHVVSVVRHPMYYVVYVSDGTENCGYVVDYLSTRDWIEGPYEAEPFLEHTDGEQLPRAAWHFLSEFRGSDEQRAGDDFRIKQIAMNLQSFMTRQYALAPARGIETAHGIEEVYPKASLSGATSIPAGSLATFDHGGTGHAVEKDFVISGCYAWASGLAGPASLEVRNAEEVLGNLVITPDANGSGEALLWLPAAVAATQLQVSVGADIQVREGQTGTVEIEFAELLSWKPQWWDAMVVARNASSYGGDENSSGVDGRGIDYEKSNLITQSLFEHGCLVNEDATAVRPQADWVNDNPIYDAMRRLTKSHSRITPRRQLVGYEVSGGRSTLYFKRFAYGNSGDRLDMWDGIAPPYSPQWKLHEGETYLVKGGPGTIRYNGVDYSDGAQFTATANPDFEAVGDARVYVKEGIRHSALRKGVTNQWLLFLETKCYDPSESSIWKPAAYSDYFTWNQRCMFYPQYMPGVVRQHVAVQYGVAMDGDDFSLSRLPMRVQTSILAPEAPTGYRYAAGSNTGEGGPNDDFCSSCMIYEPPYEIESCTVDSWDSDQILKVTLKTRLRAHPSAPASVSRNVASWSESEVGNLRAESYRTDDNAVREYLRHQYDSGYHCNMRTGDAGWASILPEQPDHPNGSCYPTFHCVHLVPEPYEDGNQRMEPSDSRVLVEAYQQIETYLRIFCEAFVDGRTSGEMVCRTGSGGLYDYTWENLCFDAFGGRWISPFSTEARADNAHGYGPMVNTRPYAEVHNRLAAAANLLTKLRIDLPIRVLARRFTGNASTGVALTPEGQNCTDTGLIHGWSDGAHPPAAEAPNESEWDILAGASMSFNAYQSSGIGCDGSGNFQLQTSRLDWEWKVEIDGPFILALPAYLRELFDASQVGLLAKTVTRTITATREATTYEDSDGCCKADDEPCPGFWREGSAYYKWVPQIDETVECGVAGQGRYSASGPPSGDFRFGRTTDMNPGTFCGNGTTSEVEVTLYATTSYVTFQLSEPS